MLQEFVHELQSRINDSLTGVHTAFPGTIVSYDASTGLATVLPQLKYTTPGGNTLDYPQITGVPVVLPQVMTQNATVGLPVTAGDGCLIVVSEQSIDYWLFGQETDTNLEHDLTNSICIPGLFNTANSVVQEACEKNAIIVDVNGTRVTVKSGEVTIDAAAITLNGDTTINGTLTGSSTAVFADDVTGAGVSLSGHHHTDSEGGTTSAPY